MKHDLAIAYAVKRRAKKMAEGGDVKRRERPSSSEGQKGWVHEKDYTGGVHREVTGEGQSYAGELARKGHIERSVERHKSLLSEMKHMPNPKLQGLAEGGPVLTDEGYESECTEHCESPCEVHPQASGYDHEMMAHGGDVEDSDDMVGRIMKKRCMSKGGEVANDDHPFKAEFETPNEFDDLVLDDHLKSQGTDNEKGDEYGSDHDDLVARVMMKRKKQYNPSPA